jgi:hypothetical protein
MRAWLLVLAAGCTFHDGDHFLTLDGTVSASFGTADRDAGDGWQRTNTELEVKLEEFRVEASTLELVTTGGGALGFDPAHPPPGYTLCHGGHCHADDGSLVPYDEVEAGLGGDDGPTTALSVPLGVLPHAIAGHVDLPQPPGRVRVTVTRLVLRGVVRDRLAPPRFDGERPFALDLAPAATVTGDVDLPAPEATLTVALPLGGALFDDLDFDACAGTSCPALVENLTEIPLTLTAKETP